MTNLEQLVEHAKALMDIDGNSREVAAAQSETSKLPNLKTQIQEFTAQVAALTTQKSTEKPIQCFYCISRQTKSNDITPTESEKGSTVMIVARWVISLQFAGSRETRFRCT